MSPSGVSAAGAAAVAAGELRFGGEEGEGPLAHLGGPGVGDVVGRAAEAGRERQVDVGVGVAAAGERRGSVRYEDRLRSFGVRSS